MAHAPLWWCICKQPRANPIHPINQIDEQHKSRERISNYERTKKRASLYSVFTAAASVFFSFVNIIISMGYVNENVEKLSTIDICMYSGRSDIAWEKSRIKM